MKKHCNRYNVHWYIHCTPPFYGIVRFLLFYSRIVLYLLWKMHCSLLQFVHICYKYLQNTDLDLKQKNSVW